MANQSAETRSTDDDLNGSYQIKELAEALIKFSGEDINRPGLEQTPDRFADAMAFLTRGYRMNLTEIVNDAVFTVAESQTDMVIVRDIPISSLCEHHLLPFQGSCHIGYIPNGQVLGLSKLARIADMFAARLQIQEKLGKEIAEAIESVISPLGIGVIIDASHTCMTMRGVKKPGSLTTTTSTLGVFKTNSAVRSEFLALLARR
jgi:GTP cyclohydrolase IA